MRRATAFCVIAALLAGGGVTALVARPAVDPLVAERVRLRAANRDAARAAARSQALERAAKQASSAAASARARQAALAARIAASAAERQASEARVAIVAALLDRRRQALSERRQPIARLIAALQSLARRPAFVAIAQPGSTDDIVHVRAMLGAIGPVVAARTAAVRQEVERVARLKQQAGIAAAALADSGRRLEGERLALVRLEAAGRARTQSLRRDAMVESDRAIALGERARDIVDTMARIDDDADIRARLTTLPGPLLRATAPRAPTTPSAYRLPVTGRVATGFGEVGDSGVRARGLTLTVAPGSDVAAPAAGRIAFSGRFRGYARVVILDHGDGWTTTLTGLAASAGPVGARVVAGSIIGRAADGDSATVTIELRRRGVPADLTAMLGR